VTETPVGAGLSFNNLFRAELRADPYPFYNRLRTLDPVRWDPYRKVWILSRAADVACVLGDSRFSPRWELQPTSLPESERAPLGAYASIARLMLFSDPPHHTKVRSYVGQAFAAFLAGAALRRRIQGIADALCDGLSRGNSVDAIREFALPFPFEVICEMLGIPPAHRIRVRGWSDDMGKLISLRWDEVPAGFRGYHQLTSYLEDLGARRRVTPEADLISLLFAEESQSNPRPSDGDLIANCLLLLTAGHLTTTNLIGNGLLALIRNPEQLNRLRHEPQLIVSAVEELLRYDSPVQITARVARDDVEIGGRRIGKEQTVYLMLGAANRDPERFAEPDRLDISRRDNRHFAFSHGPHYCLGAALGRLEGQVALTTIIRCFPNLRLEPSELEWDRNPTIRSLRSLPLAV